MPVSILVANKCGLPRGEIVTIKDASEPFGKEETMAAHGDDSTWDRKFSEVVVIDKEVKELDYLLETTNEMQKKYYFTEPSNDTELYSALYENGTVSAPFDVVRTYLMAR